MLLHRKGREYTTNEKDKPLFIKFSPVPHQTILIVLGHLIDKLIQLQASRANDLNPEVVRMFRSRDVDFQELISMETEVRTGD